MTRRLAAKVASAVRQRFVKSSSMATFKRVRRRVISAAAPLGKATGFCVTREAPGRFGRKVSTGFGPARKYFSPNVFGGLVKIRDKLSLKIRDKRAVLGHLTRGAFWHIMRSKVIDCRKCNLLEGGCYDKVCQVRRGVCCGVVLV